MKKAMFLLMLAGCVSIMATAQEKVVKNETKVTKTSTVPQKVHNTFSKHKGHNGVKVKHVKKVQKTTTK